MSLQLEPYSRCKMGHRSLDGLSGASSLTLRQRSTRQGPFDHSTERRKLFQHMGHASTNSIPRHGAITSQLLSIPEAWLYRPFDVHTCSILRRLDLIDFDYSILIYTHSLIHSLTHSFTHSLTQHVELQIKYPFTRKMCELKLDYGY